MAGVMRAVVAVVGPGRPECARGDEARVAAVVDEVVAEEPQQQRHPVALVVAAAESAAREEAGPMLGDKGSVKEALVVIGRDAEEDLLDDLIWHPRWCAVSAQ